MAFWCIDRRGSRFRPVPAMFEISMGRPKVNWILKRVPLIRLFLTAVIIGIVLHSIHTSGGFN